MFAELARELRAQLTHKLLGSVLPVSYMIKIGRNIARIFKLCETACGKILDVGLIRSIEVLALRREIVVGTCCLQLQSLQPWSSILDREVRVDLSTARLFITRVIDSC